MGPYGGMGCATRERGHPRICPKGVGMWPKGEGHLGMCPEGGGDTPGWAQGRWKHPGMCPRGGGTPQDTSPGSPLTRPSSTRQCRCGARFRHAVCARPSRSCTNVPEGSSCGNGGWEGVAGARTPPEGSRPPEGLPNPTDSQGNTAPGETPNPSSDPTTPRGTPNPGGDPEPHRRQSLRGTPKPP